MSDYYTASSDPADNTDATPDVLRAEHAAIAAGFAKIAPYTGNALKVVRINAGGTAQEAVDISTLSSGSVLSRSSNTILALSNFGDTVIATGTFTQTLTAAATLGAGWECFYRNDGTGIIMIDPNGAETIDGLAAIYLYRGESCRILCDGTAFKTFGRSTGNVLIATGSASNSATIDFTAGITSDFDEYVLDITDMVPANSGTNLLLVVSEDGATFKSGATDYAHTRSVQADAGVAPIGGGSLTDTSIIIAAALSNTGPLGAQVRILAPSATSRKKLFKFFVAYSGSGNTILDVTGTGYFNLDTNAIVGVRIVMSGGNITTGSFALFGVRKS